MISPVFPSLDDICCINAVTKFRTVFIEAHGWAWWAWVLGPNASGHGAVM